MTTFASYNPARPADVLGEFECADTGAWDRRVTAPVGTHGPSTTIRAPERPNILA